MLKWRRLLCERGDGDGGTMAADFEISIATVAVDPHSFDLAAL